VGNCLVDTECVIAKNITLPISRHITKCHLEEEKGEENEKKMEKTRWEGIIRRRKIKERVMEKEHNDNKQGV
jgi:hypothetical protein